MSEHSNAISETHTQVDLGIYDFQSERTTPMRWFVALGLISTCLAIC